MEETDWSLLRMKSTSECRNMLSYSWGYLFYEDPPLSVDRAIEAINNSRFGKNIILVGDVVSVNFFRRGWGDIFVVDSKTRRNISIRQEDAYGTFLKCKNPAGTISRECFEVFKTAFKLLEEKKSPIFVQVDGEEDLLSLVALYLCPAGASWIIYGHFKGFICAIPCTPYFKSVAKRLIEGCFEKR
jgi:uncharacterized protein (UPF0218 family)